MSTFQRLMRMGVFNQRPSKIIIESAPPFSFGAIVQIERNVPEGQIITFLDPFYSYLVGLIEKNPEIIYQIDYRKMEEIVAAAYSKQGFDEVILTPRSGDHGIDVIAIKKGLFCVKFIDQVKANKPGNLVTANDVRALLGVLSADLNATKAIFTTTSAFAPKIEEDISIKPFLPNRLELMDKEKLIARLLLKGKNG